MAIAAESSAGIEVRRLTGGIGAEIPGVDLAAPLSAAVLAAIRAALLRHKVVFFRGQRLSHPAHIAFGRRLGPLTRRPGPKHGVHPEGYPEILTVDPDAEDTRYGRRFEERLRPKELRPDSGWHVDLAAAVNPPAISVLRAETVPDHGGDTQWTSLVAAHQGLSAPLRELAAGLRAEHTLFAGCELLLSDEEDVAVIRRLTEDTLLSVHPVVRVHPETGERALFVPPASVSRIAGLLPWESRLLLELFHGHIGRPEHTVRWRWAAGDVAVWDNRAVAHLQPADLDHTDHRRTLYRVTVLGDRPAGPDGFASEAVHGEPLTAWPGS
ncbi:TauD/TfdA dioxygenase family protein [Streptomyces clavuligerus]|uniref:Taurine dioxygenase n=1 Tax=Streptomyces clavuligerus TaxID=1901 RepID=B5GVN1_STRCL|nr:TauD/TfdA family dioxygenase [Streptomyces clavuligerus]ANW17162.1 taurine dioxygenase [Streptomyces clavuligerus]AXU11702.1 TauD/TfdA family dioxygenase [Streptomyces clavuligerus]EDY50377.1 taurine dioxygenase [Streptomyces clavuligerus]EFG10382.1 Taurine dioxygenase [Streptomyces clavuligerus]MBY6301542.1 TauD/TfdA family dioxygenase [Streptomyces clavuligerus]